MESKYLTLGEIARQGLIKKVTGEPIHDQSHVSKIARILGTEKLMTKYGMSRCLTMEQIDNYNDHKIGRIVRTPKTVDKS